MGSYLPILGESLTSTRDPSDCRVSGPSGRPPHCREGGRKRKMTDARSVRFSLCWPRALSCCSCDRVLVIETSARFALLRLIRVGSDFGRRPCVHITHGRRTSSLALAPAPCHPCGIFYPLLDDKGRERVIEKLYLYCSLYFFHSLF